MKGSFSARRWIATAAVALTAGLVALPAMAHSQSAVFTGRSADLLVDRPPIAVGISIPGVINGSVVIPGSDRDHYYRDRDDYNRDRDDYYRDRDDHYRDRDDYRPAPYAYRRDSDSRWDRDHYNGDDGYRNNDYRDNRDWDNSRRDGGNYRPYDRH